VETELQYRYLGTARRKGRQQITWTYRHRATSRLYKSMVQTGMTATGPGPDGRVMDRRFISGLPSRVPGLGSVVRRLLSLPVDMIAGVVVLICFWLIARPDRE